MWVSAWPYQVGAFACYDLRDVFARCASGALNGPVRDTTLSIAADPFLATRAFTEHQWWQQQRMRIATSVMSGEPLPFTPEEEQRFIAAAPDSYITRMALGDLHRVNGAHRTAALHYTKALMLPVASVQERARLEERLRECTLSAVRE